MENKLKNSIIFKWNNSELELLPSRSIFIKETNELLISDIHLGKGEYFQSNGIPLTNNQDDTNFIRIIKLVKKVKPNKLIILGDLFHSKFSISKETLIKVEKLPEFLNIKIELIEGNHDKGCNIKNIQRYKTKRSLNLIYSHEPIKKKEKNILNICGHYHPKLYIKNFKTKFPFRCFALDEKRKNLYLPAFGDLTGGYLCKNEFKKWAIILDKSIIPV
tara:strand:- start:3387 stop:4040 length:654 start_codon:yes stop_codon:yes gene_type:complete